jgi:hypothetical protein
MRKSVKDYIIQIYPKIIKYYLKFLYLFFLLIDVYEIYMFIMFS